VYVLAVDPGKHTGVALIGPEGVVWVVTCERPYDALRSALREYGHQASVVYEETPGVHSHRNEDQREIETLILEVCHPDNVFTVRPSEWKKHPKARLSAGDEGICLTKHDKEAASIGTYFYRQRKSLGRDADRTPS
jgi:hypothetical protein